MRDIRKAERCDLDEILEIYSYARRVMIENGNPDQWGTARPTEEEVRKDIEDGNAYVLSDEEGICGVFVLITDDVEVYRTIDGVWLNDEPYTAIFRTARNRRGKGMMKEVFAFASGISSNIRINTHKDNRAMLKVLEDNGFKYCGVIRKDGGERLAYMRTKENRS